MDRKLRESGVASVADLANANETDQLSRLGAARGLNPRMVREWIATARAISSAPAAAEPDEPSMVGETAEKPERTPTTEPPERQESFVLTVSVDKPGHVQRSTIRHTRTGIEDTTPGWSPADLTTFIARHAGLAASETAAATTLAGSTTRRPGLRPVGDPVRLHLDAGHLAGGGHRSVHLAVGAPIVPWNVARYDYDLAVAARQLGRREWRPLGRARGRATTGQELVVDLARADLAPGVHRITLTGHIRAVVPDSAPDADTDVDAVGLTG